MKKIIRLLLFILACQLVGILSTPFTIASIPTWYQALEKPFFAPPNWVFGPAWTLLYALMGISAYLIYQNGWKKPTIAKALRLFGLQLLVNFIWTPIFFGLQAPLLGLVVILILWMLIVLTIHRFFFISKLAAVLLLPYLAWVSFATVLNAGIAFLN